MTKTIIVMSRKAFSIIELLMVIAVCSLMISLTIPVVSSARESARRVSCQSSLRQLGMAVTRHVDTYKFFPSNGGFREGNTIKSTTNRDVVISTDDFEAGFLFQWGVGKPATQPSDQTGSWCFSILPYIDENVAYQTVEFQIRQPLFLCPSRARLTAAVPQNDEYGNYVTGGWAWAKTDYAGNARVTPNFPFILHSAGITDGLSQTLLVGEKSFDPSVQRNTSWYWDEPLFSGGSKGTARAGLAIVADGIGVDYKENWGASHRDGAYFVVADGRTQFISKAIDWEIMRASLSPDGGEYQRYEEN
jgi:type II secretory pathway pseudopilin PulG